MLHGIIINHTRDEQILLPLAMIMYRTNWTSLSCPVCNYYKHRFQIKRTVLVLTHDAHYIVQQLVWSVLFGLK